MCVRYLLPRIDLTPSEITAAFSFKERKFQMRLAFWMINKARGEILNRVGGIYLSEPVFSHGQFIRCSITYKSFKNVKAAVKPMGRCIGNGVWKEALLKTK